MRVNRKIVQDGVDVDLDVEDHGDKAVVTANGVAILEFTSSGHLRRLKTDKSAAVGLRRLPDGRVAIKPKRASA
jgi:hypothetical protein